MASRRRGFSKNLKGIDTKVISADTLISSNIIAQNVQINSVAIDNIDFTGSEQSINFVNRELENVSITSGTILNTTISDSTFNNGTYTGTSTFSGDSFVLEGTSGQNVVWQPSTNILSTSTGVLFQPGDISISSNTISPKTLGGTIQFSGNIDFTNANAFGIGQTTSPFIVDNVTIAGNGVGTISGDLQLSSISNNVVLIGNANISAGTIDGTIIGSSVPSSATFSSLTSTLSTSTNSFITNNLSFTNANSRINIPSSVSSAFSLTDGTSDIISFNTLSNTTTFSGDVVISGSLVSATSTIKDIITSQKITINSLSNQVLITSGGTETIGGNADAVFISSTNLSGGVRISSSATSGILQTTTNGNIRMEPSAPFSMICSRDIVCSGGITISSFLNPPSNGAVQWNGTRLQAYNGSWRDLFGNRTHQEIDDHINNTFTTNPHGTTAADVGALATTGGSLSGDLSMSSIFRIRNMANPVLSQDAATKFYVDNNGGFSDLPNLKTYLGNNALSSVGSGTNLTAIGNNALDSNNNGSQNLAVGENSGGTVVNGSGNICIGSSSDVSAPAATNQIALGHSAVATTNGEFFISANATHLRMNGLSAHSGGRMITIETAATGTNRIRQASTFPVYADNAAALVGGLVAGDIYRTAAGLLAVTF